MAPKTKPVVNARLDQLSKAELIRTVKTLRGREKKLLVQVTELQGQLASEGLKLTNAQGGQADRLIDNLQPAVEFGYRGGEQGWNLERTLQEWGGHSSPAVAPRIETRRERAAALADQLNRIDALSGTALDNLLERQAAATQRIAVETVALRFPWETDHQDEDA